MEWLTASSSKNALFCFACLLFWGEVSWTGTEVTDLKHLAEKIKRHNSSESHLTNVLKLSLFGKSNVALQLNEAYRKGVIKHNKEVDNNRYILSKLIDCVKFCGAFELPLRSHDETEESLNTGVFRELVDFVSSIDSAMEAHLTNVLKLSLFGKSNIALQLNEAYRMGVIKHNEEVDKNRYILSKLIDCVKFCGAFELVLRGHDETEESLNPGVFRGLVDFVSSIDSAMEAHNCV
ncbi:hypothetical protein NDU88_009717 [Pleurodeles waltl]|uniref:DUF4371 domain-containing protein n=1 Tax=Pleurodeles waltl TaxID=8319 RepID=A0AAV7RZ82_PLEWA|nr:hypothetical protein NDU88_009717 [Pleurodeles waltl]